MDPQHLNTILDLASRLLRQTSEANSPLKPTDFFNEGWMTALTLAVVNEHGLDVSPFRVAEGGRWWCEAGLRSPFGRKNEGTTWADAVLGHFNPRKKRGIEVNAAAKQFVVIEAKIDSALAKNTTKSKDYDQAARSVACMAVELQMNNIDVGQLTSLGFFVVAPKQYKALHEPLLDKAKILGKVEDRIKAFGEPCRPALDQWFTGPFSQILEKITLECLAWEDVIDHVTQKAPEPGRMLNAFYQQCLKPLETARK